MDIMDEITAALRLEQSFRRSMMTIVIFWDGIRDGGCGETICFGVTQICLQIFSAHKYGTMPMLLNLSESQFSHLKNGDCNIFFFCMFDFFFLKICRNLCKLFGCQEIVANIMVSI